MDLMADARKMADIENLWGLSRTLSQYVCRERGGRPRLNAAPCDMLTVRFHLRGRQEPDIRVIYCRTITNVLMSWTTWGGFRNITS